MTNEEFNEQLARLNDCFKGFYNKERAKGIASTVAELPISYFKSKVDKTIWADSPPKLDWFIKIKHEYFEQVQILLPREQHPSETSQINLDKISEMIRGIFKKQNFLKGDGNERTDENS